MAVTLSDMRVRIREIADIERDIARHPNTLLNRYINESYQDLYGILTRSGLIRTEALDIVQAAGAPSYALHKDYFATIGVWEDLGKNVEPRRLRAHNPQRGPFANLQSTGIANTYRVADHLGDIRIELRPNPASGTYIHMYVPRPKTLVDANPANAFEATSFDGVLGYEDYIIYDVVTKLATRDDIPSLFQIAAAERDRIEQRIEDDENQRMLTATYRVADTRQFWFNDPADCWEGRGCYPGYNRYDF